LASAIPTSARGLSESLCPLTALRNFGNSRSAEARNDGATMQRWPDLIFSASVARDPSATTKSEFMNTNVVFVCSSPTLMIPRA
jgi:hypothetical protein